MPTQYAIVYIRIRKYNMRARILVHVKLLCSSQTYQI